jgi:hypothetical protein
MMTLLEQLLAEIEATAARESLMVARDFPTIERAYALADRMTAAGHSPLITIHTHYKAVLVTLHSSAEDDAKLRAALAAIGIAPRAEAGNQDIEPNIRVAFHAAADALQAAA